MGRWLTIEVYDGNIGDGEVSAAAWQRAHGDALVEAALTNGAAKWFWHTPGWGVVLEVSFATEAWRDAFRDLPAVRAALDAVPDPVSGLLVYRGRGGGSGATFRRRPRPAPAAGAAEVEEPRAAYLDLVDVRG